MTDTVVTTYLTTLPFLGLFVGDTVTIASIGGIIAPNVTLTGLGQNIIRVSGELQLGNITLAGSDWFGIATGGSYYSDGSGPAIMTGQSTGGSMVLNAGTITSVWGTGIYTSGDSDVVNNSGLISGFTGISLGNAGDLYQKLLNSGEIFGTGGGVSVNTGYGAIENSGLIHSAYNAALSLGGEFNGTVNVATQQEVINTGTISTTSQIAMEIYMNLSGSLVFLHNSGTIAGNGYSLYSQGESGDRITNSGTMLGAISLDGGDDVYNGQGGVLTGALFLGSGNDTADLRNGIVTDFVFGGNGSDVYFLSDSAVTIVESDNDVDLVFAACDFRLAANVDYLTLLDGGAFSGAGNGGANQLTGNASENRLTGLDGLDTLSGDLGDDRLSGGGGDDSLRGDDGNDALLGGSGLDTLRGGDGDDTLTGGASKDNLGGDAGADVFVFANLSHSAATGGNWDTVVDFDRGNDLIDLSRIDARSTNANPNDAFAFIGSAEFSAAGQVRLVVFGSYVLVELEVTGDGVADSALRLNGLSTVGASDFIL